MNPVATDIADAAPTVECLPAIGTPIGPGTTTVTCTAADRWGNSTEGTFNVAVTYVAPHTASAIWGEPVAGAGSTFVANQGRTLPVQVQLFVDGVPRTSGAAQLAITPCTGGSPVIVGLTSGSGRWNGVLDTGGLVGTCHTVEASIDGLVAGSFRLELRGSEPTKANTLKAVATTTAAPPAAPAPTAAPSPCSQAGARRGALQARRTRPPRPTTDSGDRAATRLVLASGA